MYVRRAFQSVVILMGCYFIFLFGAYDKESTIIYSDFNDSYRVNIYHEGFIIGGYNAILEVKHSHSSETKKLELFLFYDSPQDWRAFLRNVNLENDSLTLTLTPALFAYQKKLSLIDEETINMAGLAVKINIPSIEDIAAYEQKFKMP